MSIKDVTAVIDAKAIKRYCDSKRVNGDKCSGECVFRGIVGCILSDVLGLNGENQYIDAKKRIYEKLNELSK